MATDAQKKVRVQFYAADPDGDQLSYWLYYRCEGDKEWVIINPKKPITDPTQYYSLDQAISAKTQGSSVSRYYRPGHSYQRGVPYDWKTGDLADGWYMLKVVASDERDNAENAKSVWKQVGPILIDNRKPEVSQLKETEKLTWEGEATDSMGHISRVEYNVDGEKWEILKAKDGIYDNQKEQFEIKLKSLLPGEHVLTVRAFDECGNIGMRQLGVSGKASQ